MSLSNQHRIIRPANRLQVKIRLSDLSVAQLMTKAHDVMAAIGKSYLNWLRADIEVLVQAQKNLCVDPHDVTSRADLFRTAHDIRGQAASFGYDLAGDAAASLCQFLEQRDALTTIELRVIDEHINVIRACIVRSLKGDGGAVGRALLTELEALVERTKAPQ